MKLPIIAFITLQVVLLASCQKTREVQSGYSESKHADVSKEKFSDWLNVVDLQIIVDKLSKDDYLAYIEGRNNRGLDEYRMITKQLPKDKYQNSYTRSCMTSREFWEDGMKRQSAGWERVCLQVFIDASGTARHQATWVKPK